MLLNYVLPAIFAKWRKHWAGKNGLNTIFTQQDNAKPRVSKNDAALASGLIQDGFDTRLVIQPPNSLDTKLLDLGFFRAIQLI